MFSKIRGILSILSIPVAAKIPQSDYRHPSLSTWVLLFWAAMSLPRLWYLARSGVLITDADVALPLMGIGFLRDAAVAVPLLLALNIFGRRIAALAAGPSRALLITGLVVLATALGLMMVNAEVIHQTGTELEIEYFSLITDSIEGPLLFVQAPSAAALPIVHLLVVPALFVALCLRVRLIRLGWFLSSRTALLFLVSALLASATAWKERLDDETRAAVADNYFVHLILAAREKSEIPAGLGGSLREVLQTDPLPKPGVAAQEWVYPDPLYPLIKATAHHLCAAGVWKRGGVRQGPGWRRFRHGCRLQRRGPAHPSRCDGPAWQWHR